MDETLSAQAYRLDCLAAKILAGNLSAAMNKLAEDWTLPELKAIAAELSAHGGESNIYPKVKEARIPESAGLLPLRTTNRYRSESSESHTTNSKTAPEEPV